HLRCPGGIHRGRPARPEVQNPPRPTPAAPPRPAPARGQAVAGPTGYGLRTSTPSTSITGERESPPVVTGGLSGFRAAHYFPGPNGTSSAASMRTRTPTVGWAGGSGFPSDTRVSSISFCSVYATLHCLVALPQVVSRNRAGALVA